MYQQFSMSNCKSSVLHRLNHITFDGTYVYLDDVQALLNLYNFKLLQLNKRKKARNNNTVCETHAEFFLAGREVQ